MNQAPTNRDIAADHESKLESRLQNYSSVEVILADETGNEFKVTRTYNRADNHPYSGKEQYDPAQIFPVLFLSQNEIIKIAEHPDEQIAFIDRFFDFRSYQNEIHQIEDVLGDLDSGLADSLRAFQEVKPVEQSIATVNRELAALDQALKNPAFDNFAAVELKDRALREQITYLQTLQVALDTQRKRLEPDTPPPPSPELLEDPAIKRAFEIAKMAHADVLSNLENVSRSAAKHRDTLATEYATWLPQFQTAKATYEEAVQKGGGDYKNLAQKRARKVRDLEAFTSRFNQLKQKSDRIKPLSVTRNSSLDDLRAAYDRYSKERKTKCEKIEQEAAGRLQVRIHESSNVDEFRKKLMTLKRGSYLRDSEIDKICSKADPASFSKAVIRYGLSREAKYLEEIAAKIEIELDRMSALAEFLNSEFTFEELLALEYKVLPQDRPEIKYNIGQNTFEVLDKLSVGQKCTAMLIIALTEGIAPIVIDQPEDSLDIRTIWEDMCSKIRRGKERRQFVFTTHNSSLAVASDSDKFIILEGTATQAKVLYSGSLDHPPVSEEVIKYLEGGRETYKTKYDKYHLSGQS